MKTEPTSTTQDALDALTLRRREIERQRKGARRTMVETGRELAQLAADERALRMAAATTPGR